MEAKFSNIANLNITFMKSQSCSTTTKAIEVPSETMREECIHPKPYGYENENIKASGASPINFIATPVEIC